MDTTMLLAAVRRSIDAHRAELLAASDAIWEYAEGNFQEHRSSSLLQKLLADNGFAVTPGLDGMETAFLAHYGAGRPVIAVLAEYDALANMSQKSGVTEKTPLHPGAAGHGCGHNLLGTGAVAAAIAVKELIEAGEVQGTILCYGCPAEETGGAKSFMVRDGVFDGVDAALTWHPWDYNGVWPGGSLANVKLIFRFQGKSAHAAGSPHLGRSALDALELMNVGVQFLREHIPEDDRIHYAITDAGGAAPNVVQDHAEAIYMMRSPRLTDLPDLRRRVEDCARGAAMMTGTSVSIEFVKASSNVMPNTALEQLMIESMDALGVPKYTVEELDLARRMQATLTQPEDTLNRISSGAPFAEKRSMLAHAGEPLYTFVSHNLSGERPFFTVSTDAGDVSWVTPLGQVSTAAWPACTPAHSWQAVAMGKSSIAHKALELAAGTIALSAARLLAEPALVAAAREEHAQRLADAPYVCPVPAEAKPHM